jgi:hypothetical protein
MHYLLFCYYETGYSPSSGNHTIHKIPPSCLLISSSSLLFLIITRMTSTLSKTPHLHPNFPFQLQSRSSCPFSASSIRVPKSTLSSLLSSPLHLTASPPKLTSLCQRPHQTQQSICSPQCYQPISSSIWHG